MENASKALLIAAEVLISIIIIGALLLMFNSLTDYQKVTEKNEEEAQIIEFNNSYEAYNQKDVRGNELYSLINKVVDYNRRKSTKGTGEKDEGQYLKYEPMTIAVNLATDTNAKNNLTFDKSFRIFTGIYSNGFEINSTNNAFDELFENIRKYERDLYIKGNG